MEPSQVLLIVAIVGFAVYALRIRTILTDRLIYLLLAGVGVLFVLAPQLSTWVANRIGIGRGADLVLYLFVVFSVFHFVTRASHLNTLERQITALTRRAAISDARLGGTDDGERDGAATVGP